MFDIKVLIWLICYLFFSGLIPYAQADILPSQFILEEDGPISVWCKYLPATSEYSPIVTPIDKTPSLKDELLSRVVNRQKAQIKIVIKKLRIALASTKLKVRRLSIKAQIRKNNNKLLSIDEKSRAKFELCDSATSRFRGEQDPPETPTPVISTPVSPTPTATPEPTPRPTIEETLNFEINQNSSQTFTVHQNSGSYFQLLPSTQALPVGLVRTCEIANERLTCAVSNGTFVGSTKFILSVKQLFSSHPQDYQTITYEVRLQGTPNPSSMTILNIPTQQQLVDQFKDLGGDGIRPWSRIDTGIKVYAQNGDTVSSQYITRFNSSIITTLGNSVLIKPLPSIDDRSETHLRKLSLCAFLESSLISSPITWHDLNVDGTPKQNGATYILRSYQPAEFRSVVKSYLLKVLTRYSEFSSWKDANAEIGRSMIAQAYTEAYSCVKDEIDSSLRQQLEDALITKFINPTIQLLNTGGWPVNGSGKVDPGNQGIEVASVLAQAGVAVMKERPDEGAYAVNRALGSLDRFLNVLYRGGSLEEGPNYEDRSFDYLIRLDEVLWKAFGTNFGLLSPNSAVARESARWMYSAYGPNGYLFAFNDSHPFLETINSSKRIPWGLGIGLYLAHLFNDPNQAIMEIGKLRVESPGATHILYYKPYNESQIYAATPMDYTSSGFPLFSTRSDFTSEALYLAAVGQVHGWIHNHKAPGNFVLQWKGVPFIDTLHYEKSHINVAFDSANYWTQVSRIYDLLRFGTMGSNSLTLTSPVNQTYLLTSGRPTGYESETDPNIEFSDSVCSSGEARAVLDMSKVYHNYNPYNYASGSQQGWPLPTGRFVTRATRGFGLDRSDVTKPWAYVCDDALYSGGATTKISFNTPATISQIDANIYRLTYLQPIDSSTGTRTVSLTVHIQSSRAHTVAIQSLNDISSNPIWYPSWWPWDNVNYQCNVNPGLPNCNAPTHLPNMSRFNLSVTGPDAKVCLIFVPDTGGVGFSPPAIPAVSNWGK